MARRIVFGLALVCMIAVWSEPALALDPALDLSQYAHTAWKIRDGFSGSAIDAFAQTPDGYLWLGTGTGLTRFDGVQNRPWQPPPGASLPNDRIRTLFVSRDGSLWIATAPRGLARWDGRTLRSVPQFDNGPVDELYEDREGTLWAAGAASGKGLLCTIGSAGAECAGEDGRFGPYVTNVHEDRMGTLWLAAANGLWRWKPGPSQLYTPPDQMGAGLQLLSETNTGAILIVTRSGIQQFADGKFTPLPLPTMSITPNLFRDRDGANWIGTYESGLLHVRDGRVDAFARPDGLSGNRIARLFEDREGNVWVATNEGLDRFRALPVTTYGEGQGLSGVALSVLADSKGSTWLNTTTGLYRRQDGRWSAYRPRGDRSSATASSVATQPAVVEEVAIEGLPKPGLGASLFEDRNGRIWLGSLSGLGYIDNGRFVSVSGLPAGAIASITEDQQGKLWVAHADAGLFRVSTDRKAQQVKWPNPGKPGDWWRLAADPVEGLWLGSLAGGVVHWIDGTVRASYSAADGLGKGVVNDVRVAADGTVWVATNGGLSRIKASRIATLNETSGLPCDQIISSTEDKDGSIWLYAACGLVRIARSELDSWADAADRGKAAPSIRTTVLDNADGLSSLSSATAFTPALTIGRDGKLWLQALDGVAVVDPRHLPINTLPPPVHVEQIVADRKTYPISASVSLPPLVRDLTIDYTGLSLVAPEKMQFRYRLEGRDKDWEEAGNRRQAFYTDLAPGNYRFRVIASNNSGVWNEEGASLAFTIAPAYWQTNWFLALCATAFAALLWGAYRTRMRVLARQRDMQMELAHANRLATMGQLTATIAHEVNQPLGATITNVQAALRWLQAKSPDPKEVREALDQAVLAGNRAADVIARIRRLAKKAHAQEEAVSLNGEIDEILTITHGEAVKHGVSVRTELAHDLPAITADRVELQRVLLNLIVNAIEAMGNVSGGPRELVIRSEADGGGGVVVSVIDTGPGLDPEALERIFQPFYTSKENGLGMGLSICRSIVESYGGKLWASANSPRGAVFQFTLPPKRPY